MIHRHLNVLLVDDEPDVLTISKLALRRMSLYGLPTRVHTAASKAEAIEFLTTHPEGRNVALAMIDVVMETDQAGLELCAYIRETLGNQVTPLIVRTGQAGKAPEREVIDRYEISGYVNKVEATEGRLYSLVKGAVRQYLMTAYDYYASQLLYHLVMNLRSAARARKAVSTVLDTMTRSVNGARLESLHDSHCLVSDRFHAGAGALADLAKARQLRDTLAQADSESLSITGDRLTITDDYLMLHIEGTQDHVLPLQSIWSIGAAPPAFVIGALYRATKQIQVLLSLQTR